MQRCCAPHVACVLALVLVTGTVGLAPEKASSIRSLDPEETSTPPDSGGGPAAGYEMAGVFTVQPQPSDSLATETNIELGESSSQEAHHDSSSNSPDEESIAKGFAQRLKNEIKKQAKRMSSRYANSPSLLRSSSGRTPLSVLYGCRDAIRRLEQRVQSRGLHYSTLNPESAHQHPLVQRIISDMGLDESSMGELGAEGVKMVSEEILSHVMSRPIREARQLAAKARKLSSHARRALQAHRIAAVQPYLEQLSQEGNDLGEGAGQGDALQKVLNTWSEQEKAGARAVYETVLRRAERAITNARTILVNRHIRKFEQKAEVAFKDIAKYINSKWLKTLVHDVEQTNSMPKMYITLPTHGEGSGVEFVDKDMREKLDSEGYGYGGGSTSAKCSEFKTCVTVGACKAQPSKCNVPAPGGPQLTLTHELFDSREWKDSNVRYVPSSSGIVEGGVSPRAFAMSKDAGYKYSYNWFSTCQAPSDKCNEKSMKVWADAGFDLSDPSVATLMPQACWYENMRTQYPTPFGEEEFEQLAMYKWAEHIRNAVGGQTDIGTAILGFDMQTNRRVQKADSATAAWRLTVSKQQYAKEGFWNSNTAVGPYVRCGMCKRTKCMSLANSQTTFGYHLNAKQKLCSAAEISSDACSFQESTEYCQQETTAQCLYIRYCAKKEGGCVVPEEQSWEQAGWSDKIYDCEKLVDLSGVSGNDWCSQLVR